MGTEAVYRDRRADFWREHFERALPYDAYLAASPEVHAAKWRAMESSIPALDASTRERLTGHARQLNLLVYSGVWCGDCVRQGPMLQRLAAAVGPAPGAATLRFVERDGAPALQEELRVLGALRVPVAVFLSEDFHEVGRFGDRLLTVYRAKRERETGEACALGLLPPPEGQLAAELAEWADIVERMLLMLRLAPPLRARHGD
ncbi:MAG: thioredoxin family protein [Candidatus Krumholzibacteriia bacterium]|nr:thioredoxin family protein [Candidatus Latescibacterota bacterium]